MKKKIIYGLLFAVAMVTASSSFVSCKDYEGDDYANWQNKWAESTINQNSSLKELIEYQKHNLGYELQNALANAKDPATIAAINGYIGQLNGITYDPNSFTSMLNAIKALNTLSTQTELYTDDSLKELRKVISDSLANAYDSIIAIHKQVRIDSARISRDSLTTNTRIDTLSIKAFNRMDSLYKEASHLADSALKVAKDSVFKWYIQNLQDRAAALEKQDSAFQDSISRIDSILLAHADSLDAISAILAAHGDSINALNARCANLLDSVLAHTVRINDIEKAYKAADKVLQQQITLLNNDLNDVKADVKALNDAIEDIVKFARQEITGITIQNVWNPVFGAISLPFDVQSNILALRYGEASAPVDFPIDATGDGWVTNAVKPAASEMPTPKNTFSLAPGTVFDDQEGNAGRVYLTINPSNVDWSGATFSVRTTNNAASVVTLGALEDCDEMLLWGVTRNANGFYTAKATIDASKINDALFRVNASAVKDAAREVMNNWRTPSDINKTTLANAVYKNVQQNLPRLGVQAQWTDALTEQQKSYVSRYDLAATAVKAAGFDLLEGDYSNRVIKLRDRITGKISSSVESELASLVNLSLGIPSDMPTEIVLNKTDHNNILKVQVLADGTEPKDIVLPAGGPQISGEPTVTPTIETITVGGVDKQVVTNVTVSISGITISYNPTITRYNPGDVLYTAQIDLSEVASDMNKMLAAFNGIQSTIDSKMAQIKRHINAYKDAINNRINQIFSPVVKLAANPNRFLQPYVYAAVNGGESVAALSTDVLLPTHIKATGAESGIGLFPTSLTGEIIAPALKKYIAVTHVTKGGVEQEAIKAAINNQDGWNDVLDGAKYNAGAYLKMPVTTAMQGCQIEILVEYLGYNGKITARKFHIVVD